MTRSPGSPGRSPFESIPDLGEERADRQTLPPDYDYGPVRVRLTQISTNHPYWGHKLKLLLDKIIEANLISPAEIMDVLNRQEPLGALVHFENLMEMASKKASEKIISAAPVTKDIPPAKPSSKSVPGLPVVGVPNAAGIKGGNGTLDGLNKRVKTLLGVALAEPEKPAGTPSVQQEPISSRKPQK